MTRSNRRGRLRKGSEEREMSGRLPSKSLLMSNT
jgi:hypothetical protein